MENRNCFLKLFSTLIFLYILIPYASPTSGNDTDIEVLTMKRLRKDLLANYDKTIRPGMKIVMPLLVQIGFSQISLLDLDEKMGTVTISARILLIWTDYRLKWNPNNYDNLHWAHLESDELWLPNIVVVNCFPITDTKPWNIRTVFVFSSGIIYQVQYATIRTRCPEIFKQDKNKKTCNITIGRLMSKGNEINLKVHGTELQTSIFENNNTVWEVTDMKYYLEDYQSNPRYSSMITFSLNLKRRFDFTKYVGLTDGPRTVAILLTLVMFWVPPNSYKKINLGCLVLLLLSSLMLYLSSTVPSPSLLSPTVAPLRNTFLIAASALFIEVIILNMPRMSSVLKISPTVIRILSGMVGKIIGVCPPREFKDDTGMTTFSENNEDQTMTKQCLSAEEEWFMVAMSLDRIFFVIYLVIILIA